MPTNIHHKDDGQIETEGIVKSQIIYPSIG